ncbi:MAG TPA: 2-phospho-L-lactate transferase [Ktedonobacterales bacterium]|nr:2-phospho-L-lactate transferase [Ktedonobacterales bacterium]
MPEANGASENTEAQGGVVALAGGVGGARLAHGLALALADTGVAEGVAGGAADGPADGTPSGAERLAVISNTADDFDLYGLRISPDADTVLYTLAGLANEATGWGVTGDTFTTLDQLKRYGEAPWFWLGDRDFATHILRTQRLRMGESLTQVMRALGAALGVRADLLPMTDDPVATFVRTPAGELAFQDYFVRRQHADTVLSVRFAGIEQARLPEATRDAIRRAGVVIVCPSNPFVSVAPILAVPGMLVALRGVTAPTVAVSPIVGGQAIKGPAAVMLANLGHEVSAYGVAALYADHYPGLLHGFVLDRADAADAPRIEALGLRTLVADTIMRDAAARKRLARETLAFAQSLRDVVASGTVGAAASRAEAPEAQR